MKKFVVQLCDRRWLEVEAENEPEAEELAKARATGMIYPEIENIEEYSL